MTESIRLDKTSELTESRSCPNIPMALIAISILPSLPPGCDSLTARFPPDESILLRAGGGTFCSRPPTPGGARRWPRPAGTEEQPRLQPG